MKTLKEIEKTALKIVKHNFKNRIINKDNFFKSTHGEFKTINDRKLKTLIRKKKSFLYEGKKYIHLYTSASDSIYFKCRQNLLRLADHWSNRSKCYYIKSCFWKINEAGNFAQISFKSLEKETGKKEFSIEVNRKIHWIYNLFLKNKKITRRVINTKYFLQT